MSRMIAFLMGQRVKLANTGQAARTNIKGPNKALYCYWALCGYSSATGQHWDTSGHTGHISHTRTDTLNAISTHDKLTKFHLGR